MHWSGLDLPTSKQIGIYMSGCYDPQKVSKRMGGWFYRIRVGKEHPDPFVSIYRAPEPSLRSAKGVLVQCTGLVPTQFIRHVMVTVG